MGNLIFWYLFKSIFILCVFVHLPWTYLNQGKKSVISKKQSKLNQNERLKMMNMACHSSSASSLRITNSMAIKGALSFPPTPSPLFPFLKASTFVSLRASTKQPTKSFQGFLFLSFYSMFHVFLLLQSMNCH